MFPREALGLKIKGLGRGEDDCHLKGIYVGLEVTHKTAGVVHEGIKHIITPLAKRFLSRDVIWDLEDPGYLSYDRFDEDPGITERGVGGGGGADSCFDQCLVSGQP